MEQKNLFQSWLIKKYLKSKTYQTRVKLKNKKIFYRNSLNDSKSRSFFCANNFNYNKGDFYIFPFTDARLIL